MSLVKSHHIKMNDVYNTCPEVSDEMLSEITMYLINHHAALIVDVESGYANHQLIEKEVIAYLDAHHPYNFTRDVMIQSVLDYMFGYGILQPLIDNEDVTDIDVCRYNYIIYKKYGKKQIATLAFNDEKTFNAYCKLIVIRHGGTLNEKDCHARVADRQYRLRINVTIEPRNTSGASMTIRKHRQKPYILEDLIRFQMMNAETALLLKQLMKTSSRVLIIGKGAAGKTTLLRALLKEIPTTERFLVCESESELYPEQLNFIVQKVNHKEKGASLNRLVRDGLTMSLDGYCIGELVGEEIYEFIKAGYTDHRILGTLHAPSVRDTVPRIKMMLKNHQKLLVDAFIAGAFDIIIYLKKFKVHEITELTTIGEKILYNELVIFNGYRETLDKVEGTWEIQNPLKYRLKEELLRRNYT